MFFLLECRVCFIFPFLFFTLPHSTKLGLSVNLKPGCACFSVMRVVYVTGNPLRWSLSIRRASYPKYCLSFYSGYKTSNIQCWSFLAYNSTRMSSSVPRQHGNKTVVMMGLQIGGLPARNHDCLSTPNGVRLCLFTVLSPFVSVPNSSVTVELQ